MAQDVAAAREADQEVPQQQAPAPAKDTPGVAALRGMLAGGVPDPGKVVELIDAHRGEHDAMLALLHQTLGNAYVQRVVQAMDHLRLSTSRKELAAGDPGDPNGGYFVASQELQGAKWRTAGGGFTGTVDKKGLDTTAKVGEHDALHGKVGADKTGSLAWEHDGKTEGELYGHYGSGKDYEVGVKRTQDAFGGSMTEGVRHRQTASGAVDEAFGTYKSTDGKTEAQGAAGVQDGKFVGSLSGTEKLGDKDTIKGSVAHDAKGTTASISETHKLDDKDTITGTLSHDPKGTSSSLAAHRDFKGGTADASLAYGPDGTTAKISAEDQVAKDTKVSGAIASDKGQVSENLAVTQKLGAHDTLSGSISHDPKGTSATLAEHHALQNGAIDTKLARTPDATSLSISGQDQVSKELSVSGSLAHEHKDAGGDQTSLTLGEKYRSGNLVQGLDLSAGAGTHNYLKSTGSVDAKLAPNLYGGAWGSVGVEGGHQTTAQLGASLTFTPQEKTALTLAGVVNEHGTLETRLQLDVFKDKLNGVGDLADHKKDALLSLFLSYSTQTGHPSMLDDRFGAPQFGTTKPAGDGQVMAGIKIRF